MFISDAFASGGIASQDIVSTVVQLGLIFLIFYLLLIRPQQKKMKQYNEMLMAVKTGDKIITGGGIYAKVKKVDGQYITAEIADGVEVILNRTTIRDVVIADAKETKKDKDKNKTKKDIK